MLDDLAIRLRQNIGFVTAVLLFCVVLSALQSGASEGLLLGRAGAEWRRDLRARHGGDGPDRAGAAVGARSLGRRRDDHGGLLRELSAWPARPAARRCISRFFGLHLGLGTFPGGIDGILLGIAVCVAIGTLAGFINGCVVVYGRIQPIIATLATGAIYIGVALFLRPTPGGKIDEDLNWALTNSLGDFASTVHIFDDGAAGWFAPFAGIPVPFVLLVLIALLVWVPFRRSVTGRAVYAVGSAEGAAYMSGLPIERAKIAAFTLGGFFAGCGGLFLAIQTSSGNADIPQAGAYTLNSIASVVIGGTSLLGGTGGAIGSIFGAMILRVISFFFRIFDIAPLLQPLFEGLILLAAVSIGALGVLRVKNTLELFR